MIYLDNAATTKIAPKVLAAMMPYLGENYGNAGSLHSLGREANKAVEHAREQVAFFLGVQSKNIIFTSGGSEANNLVFLGVSDYLEKTLKKHVIVSQGEHESVLNAVYSLFNKGFLVDYAPLNNSCCVDLQFFKNLILPKTGLVSIMAMNNEVGSIESIGIFAQICSKKGILFHSDCVQAAGQIDLSSITRLCDFVSISSHKIHGPKGVGALYVKDTSILKPIIYGGSVQEFGLRGGTENVAGIVGFGEACDLTKQNYFENMKKQKKLTKRFFNVLQDRLSLYGLSDLFHFNGDGNVGCFKTYNIRFDGIPAETLIMMLDSRGVMVSAGSACTSHDGGLSHVLVAMGMSEEEVRSSIRVSFSDMNTEYEVENAAQILAECVYKLHSSM